MEKLTPQLRFSRSTSLVLILLGFLILLVVGISLKKDPGAVTSQEAGSTDNKIFSTPSFTVITMVSPTVTKLAFTPTATQLASTQTVTPFVLPESHYLKIIANHQYFALGCEAQAAVDLAGYYDILIYQYNFQHELPLSDNPDLGFVGDANGPWGQVPPYAYGVHAAPVAELLQKYGLDVEGEKNYSLDKIKQKLAMGHPVIVWVIGNMEGGVPAEYTDLAGNKTIVAAYEHVVILTGYDQDSLRYVSNGRFFDVPYDVFLNSWGVLGNMAVFHR